MYSTCCKLHSGNRSHFLVSVDFRLSQNSLIIEKEGSRAKSMSQTRVQLYWANHIMLSFSSISTAPTRAALTHSFSPQSASLFISRNPPFLKPGSCISLWIWRPSQTNKLRFCLQQFSKRRATSAINYISAIKVPTSDLAWPAQPRSPDFCIGRSFRFNWHSCGTIINKERSITTGFTGRSRLLKSVDAFAYSSQTGEKTPWNKRTLL